MRLVLKPPYLTPIGPYSSWRTSRNSSSSMYASLYATWVKVACIERSQRCGIRCVWSWKHVYQISNVFLLILSDEMKLLQKPHPLLLFRLLKLNFGLRMINVDNCFLTHYIILPPPNIFNHEINFLIIRRVY